MVWIGIVLVLIGLDQAVKYLIVRFFQYGDVVPVIDGFFYLTHWKNQGAAWGILQGKRTFLVLITLVALIFLVYMFLQAKTTLERGAILSIVGGALGNFMDRLMREGGVVDFLLFRFGSFDYPAFNVADMLIVCGSIVLVWASLIEIKKDKGKEKQA